MGNGYICDKKCVFCMTVLCDKYKKSVMLIFVFYTCVAA